MGKRRQRPILSAGLKRIFFRWLVSFAFVVMQIGCGRQPAGDATAVNGIRQPLWPGRSDVKPSLPEPCKLVLLPLGGETLLDKDILRAQEQARKATNPSAAVERLGWLFVSKARVSFDPGFYKLAEQCGIWLESKEPRSPEALLLRGHSLQNLHRFREAEPLARDLVAMRGLAFDYGLLGDVLMEVGRLDEAVEAYQKMADLKPDLQAYTRIAHLRWLKGDLQGATEMMQMAVQAATPRSPETAAWVYTRMALYELQAGDFDQALQMCDGALSFQTEYPPALLAKGCLLLAQGKAPKAIQALSMAAKLNPLPEYQWTLAEALRSAGQTNQAIVVESLLKQHGSAADPRTLALYLSSRGEESANAIRLAEAELTTREDVFTHDALAWSLAAANHLAEAANHLNLALAEGTQDARLFLHAGIIYGRLGKTDEATKYLDSANAIQQMLLPCEKSLLAEHFAQLKRQVPEQVSIEKQ